MKAIPFVLSAALIAGCASDSSQAPRASLQHPLEGVKPPIDAPRLQFFSSTDSAMSVVDGAGCGYTAPGVTGDSSLFVFSTDGAITVGGRAQILKLTSEGMKNDGTDEVRFENAAYRVVLRTQTDSMMEAGVSQHGEMMVEDKATGAKTTVAVVGGCGC